MVKQLPLSLITLTYVVGKALLARSGSRDTIKLFKPRKNVQLLLHFLAVERVQRIKLAEFRHKPCSRLLSSLRFDKTFLFAAFTTIASFPIINFVTVRP